MPGRTGDLPWPAATPDQDPVLPAYEAFLIEGAIAAFYGYDAMAIRTWWVIAFGLTPPYGRCRTGATLLR